MSRVESSMAEGGENETIEEDEDFGKFHGEKIVPVGMSSGACFDG